MTAQEMKNALINLTAEYRDACLAEARMLEKTAKHERQALMMQKQLAENCIGFLNLTFADDFGVRERRVFAEQLHYFDAYREGYQALSQEEKECFLVFAFSVSMVRHCLMDGRVAATNAREQFEGQVMRGALGHILSAWQALWNEKGCLACEVGI